MAETDSDKELNLAGLKGIDTSNPEGSNPEGEPETNPILQSSKDKIKSSDNYIKPKSKDSAFRSNLANSAVTGITNDTIIGSNLMVDKKLTNPQFTPIDLALAIPDPRERAKYIKEHGSNMTQLLNPDVYGVLFNRDVADYAQYRKKNYNNKLKTFVDDLDNNQGFWESMGIVSAKLGGDVVNNLGANLVAPVYGLGAALFNWGDTGEWDSSKIYDNDVTDYFKKNLEYLDNELVIYGGTGYGKDKEKADKINDALSGGVLRGTGNFFSRVTTHPFKSINEDIVPTISFVAAAVGSEMILKRVGLTGGGFIGNNLARAGAYGVKGFSKGYRVIRGLDKLSDIQAMRRVITTADRIKKTAGTIGTMYRSAAYESGMIGQDVQDNTLLEAKFGYIKKNPELFAEYNRLVRENTTEFGVLTADNAKLIEQVALRIPKGELAVMANTSKNAGMAAFLTNIPLVGASYMIQFPKVFGAGYRNSQKILSKTGTLYGTTRGVSGKLTSNFSKAAWYEKLAYKYILPGATSGVTEGFEEFSQGVIEKGYTDYWASPYTKNSAESSISFLSAMSNASRKYAKSVEGQDSMTLGFLMGVLGIPMFKASSNKAGFKVGWSGGAYEAVQEVKDKISEVELAITKYNEGVQTNDVLKNNFDSFRKSISIEENSDRALEEGDVFAYKNAEHDALHNYVTNRINNGILDTVYQDIEGLEEMSLEEFNEQFAHKDEAFQFTEKTKKKNLETLKNNVDAIANSVDTVEKVFNDKRVWVDKFFNKNYKGLDPILKDDILNELTDNTGAFKNKNLQSYVKQNPEEAFAIKHFIQSKQTLLKEKAIYLLSSKNNLQKREKQLKERLNELVPNANLDALYKDENYKEVLAAIEKGDQIYFAEEEGKKKLSSFIKEITGQIKEDNFKEYNFNKDEIDGIVNDIFKIRTTEAKVSEIYSTLFTNKGANNWLKLKSSLEEQYVELILENQEEILKEQAERVQDASSLKTILNLYKELFGTELPAHSDNIKKQLNTLKEKIDPENLVYEDIVAGLKDFKNPNLIEHIFDLLQKQNKLPQKIEYTIDKIDLVKNDQDFKNDFLEAFETILNNYESIIDDINSILDAANKNKDNRQTPSQKPYTKDEQKKEESAAMDSVFEQIAKKNNIGFIPIFHDKELLIDPDNRVLGVRHKISGSKRGPALKTINGKENTQPKIKGYNTKVINSANDLNNKYLQENVVYASFKFATETNEKGNSYGDKTVYDADSIGIDVYIGDLFVGKVPTTGNSPSSKALRAALFNGTVNEDGTIIGTESTTTTQEYTGYESTATVAPKTETKETTTQDIEAKKADIEKRRKEEIDDYYSPGDVVNPIFVSIRDQIINTRLITPAEKRKTQQYLKALMELGISHQEMINKINAQYDFLDIQYKETEIDRINNKAELAALEKQTTTPEAEVEAKKKQLGINENVLKINSVGTATTSLGTKVRIQTPDGGILIIKPGAEGDLNFERYPPKGKYKKRNDPDPYDIVTLQDNFDKINEKENLIPQKLVDILIKESEFEGKKQTSENPQYTDIQKKIFAVSEKANITSTPDQGPTKEYREEILDPLSEFTDLFLKEIYEDEIEKHKEMIVSAKKKAKKDKGYEEQIPIREEYIAVYENEIAALETTSPEREMSEAEEMYVGIQDIMMELEPGTKEWDDAVSEMAEFEDIIVKEFEEKGLPSPRPTTQKGVKIRKETSKKDFAAAKKEYEKVKKLVDAFNEVTDTIAEMFQYQLIMMRNYSTNLLKEMVARKKAKIEKYSTSTEKRFKTLLPYLKSELKAIENIIEEGITSREAALQTTSPETEVEQTAREKVIEENFKSIIKQLTVNPIVQEDAFIGKEKC